MLYLYTNDIQELDFFPKNLDTAVTVYILRAILLETKKTSLKHKTDHPLSLQRSELGLHFTLKPV